MHRPPEARILPSGLKTTIGDAYCDSSSMRFVHLPMSISNSFTVLPPFPTASVLPLGLNANDTTQYSATFVRVLVFLPVDRSQNLIELSPLPEARDLPSGLKARDTTTSVCPLSVAFSLTGSSARVVPNSFPEANAASTRIKHRDFIGNSKKSSGMIVQCL